MQLSIYIVNKNTLYLNGFFSDRLFFTRPHQIALLPVSASIYYGFPAGKKTYAQWVQALIDAYNSGLPPNEHISNIPGFQGNDNKTFDVRTINLNVWKLRKP
jgi:hypothetical protein